MQIDAQLKPILDAILAAAMALGPVTVQAVKRMYPWYRPAGHSPGYNRPQSSGLILRCGSKAFNLADGLQPSKIHESMPLQISLLTRDEVDAEVFDWLKRTYNHNR
jgi:hypothetical protein